MSDDLDLDLDLDLDTTVKSNQTVPQAKPKSGLHIDWSQNIPTKANDQGTIVKDPNNFYKQNLQFLTGQRSGQDRENVKRPIFRLAILLDSGPNSLAKRIFVPNSTNPAEIDNVPSDYYNITQPENIDNLSVFFIDFIFEWTTTPEGVNSLKPIWVTSIQKSISQVTADSTVRIRPVKTLPSFNLMPYGQPKNGMIYTDGNPFCRQFWKQITPSFNFDKEKYSNIYTIWFQKKYFGFNVIEEIFADTTFKKQVKDFKDISLNKKIIDLFDLSDLITPNEPLSKKNDIFLLFTKWLNYKNTSMSASSDVFNKKFMDAMKTETIGIDFFKRIDDFMYYTSKCFINILDQCLYENWINQLGAKGILLEDFFIKDYAVGGTNQDTNQEFVEFVDEEKTEEKESTKKQDLSWGDDEGEEDSHTSRKTIKKPAKKVTKKPAAKKSAAKKKTSSSKSTSSKVKKPTKKTTTKRSKK